MCLRKLTIRVHDPEHRLFEQGAAFLQGIDADSLVLELFPNGPSARVVVGLYAEAYCPSEGRRWRFYAGQVPANVCVLTGVAIL
jgi:hypothetical protein